MTSWHRATIKFQYSPKRDLSHRSITTVTTQVYGDTESAAMQALRKMYLVVQTDDSDKVVRRHERELQNNQYGHGVPKLNGVVK